MGTLTSEPSAPPLWKAETEGDSFTHEAQSTCFRAQVGTRQERPPLVETRPGPWHVLDMVLILMTSHCTDEDTEARSGFLAPATRL